MSVELHAGLCDNIRQYVPALHLRYPGIQTTVIPFGKLGLVRQHALLGASKLIEHRRACVRVGLQHSLLRCFPYSTVICRRESRGPTLQRNRVNVHAACSLLQHRML